MKFLQIESGSERIPRGLLRGKRANGEHYYSLWIGDAPQVTAESFNSASSKSFFAARGKNTRFALRHVPLQLLHCDGIVHE
jgi:hypothetical protein